MGNTETWQSVEDVATHLGEARHSAYRSIERCGLLPHKIGRLGEFKPSEVDARVRAGGAEDGETAPREARAKSKRGRR
jgi:hypothetical protein